MSNLVFRLPRYYQDSPQVSELERVLGEQAGALCVSESDTLAQLWVDTATWGLDLWEQWVGLPADRTRPYSYRRSRIKAKLRGQGATTAEMLRSVVASFGFEPSQISVIEHPAEYQFEIVLSELAGVPADVGGIEAAVNEIKPAHLDYWFTYQLAQLLATLRVGGVAVNRPDPADVLDVLHKVGGLDIAGLAGVFLGGALCHTPVLVDGFISSVAALVAARLCPACKDYMLGSHASEEPASRLVLSELGLRPFLYAGMRLGEGTGAVAVMPLLDMGLAVYREMATFEDTNIEAYQPLG